jgi:AcrR family transcriptional regulator
MQKRSEATRTQIILAASDLFSKFGYNPTGVAEICSAAGVSKGAFYHHFSSKQSVFLAIFTEWIERLDTEIQNSRDSSNSVPEAIGKMLILLETVFQQGGGYLPMFLEFWSQASHDPLIWQVVIEPYQHYRAYFTRMIQDGIDEGSICQVDPLVTASTIVSLALGLLLQGLIDPKGAEWGNVTRTSVTQFLNAIYTKPNL